LALKGQRGEKIRTHRYRKEKRRERKRENKRRGEREGGKGRRKLEKFTKKSQAKNLLWP
jgi:hypothetical protein